MKTLISSIVALSFIAVTAPAGVAQTRPATPSERSAPTKPSSKAERAAWANKEGLHDTKDITGTRIKNADGKDVGEIDALLIDPKDGKVTHAVVGLGGFLGIGEDKVVVPWSDIKVAAHQEGKKAVITMDPAILERAPKYVKASDRSPSASPRSTDPTRTDTKRDADGKPTGEKKY